MPMSPPAAITVGPHVYRIVIVPDGILSDAGQEGHAALTRNVIAIDGEFPPTRMADTLLHEAAHAMLNTIDLGEDGETEERVALILGPALLALILDNPELIDWVRSLR